MGSDRDHTDEAPVHEVTVSGFRMESPTVTTAQCAAFVAVPGYNTGAERPRNSAVFPGADLRLLVPGSLVFHITRGPVDLRDMGQCSSAVPGACWHRSENPGISIKRREGHPAIQVAFEDARAYAGWAGKSLPTEAEWEIAARGGLESAGLVWGDALTPGGKIMAKTWQGSCPWYNKAPKRLHRMAPVGADPDNGHAPFDMAGNVWQ